MHLIVAAAATSVATQQHACGHGPLTSKIIGYYPFPEAIRTRDGMGGVLGWAFRDTHQAINVRASSTDCNHRISMDFMTEGGQAHPVWYNEAVKWSVFLGADIVGEVRIRESGKETVASARLESLKRHAESYPTRMNLYTSNCRHFVARMQREVDRLNALDARMNGKHAARVASAAADLRLWLSLLRASLLPALYPAVILIICWEGLRDL